MSRSRRATRIKACELAAEVMRGQGTSGAIGSRMMSLTIFFENYIDLGANETERTMKMMTGKRIKRAKLRVITGGNLG